MVRVEEFIQAVNVSSAVFLFFPVAAWTYRGAYLDGVLTARAAVVSTALGRRRWRCPWSCSLVKDRPFFEQT